MEKFKEACLQIVCSVCDEWIGKFSDDHSNFWKSFLNSYYHHEINLIKNQVFISSISFYPSLIQKLSEYIKSENNIAIEITFFSTLLPRHFWNFPIIKPKIETKDNKDKDNKNYYISSCPIYLELYRNQLCNLLKNENKNFKLKRIIILSDKEGYFRDTRLFSVKEFRTDNSYYIKQDSMDSHKMNWDRVSDNLRKINEYSIGIHRDKLTSFFNENYLMNKEVAGVLEKLRTSKEYFYNFAKKESNGHISVLKYYLNNLHSKDSSKIFIVGDSEGTHQLFGNTYKRYKIDDLNLSQEFEPDLGLVVIKDNNTSTNIKIILNTYMDIINDIVRMEVVTEGHSKYNDLSTDVECILKETEAQPPLFSGTTTTTCKTIIRKNPNR